MRQIKTRRSPAASITTPPSTSIAAPTSVAASPAIASARVDRIARTIQCGIVTTEPVGNAPAVSAAAIAASGSGTVARWSAIGTAVLQPGHQRIADQGCTADRNCEGHHGARHHSPTLEPAAHPGLRTATRGIPVLFRRQMWQLRSLIIQAKCGTFTTTDRLFAVLCSMRKVKP